MRATTEERASETTPTMPTTTNVKRKRPRPCNRPAKSKHQRPPPQRRQSPNRMHRIHHEYFRHNPPHEWDIEHFLENCVLPGQKSSVPYETRCRRALDSWPKELSKILRCETCCSADQKLRAAGLRERYEKTGNTSDKAIGRHWAKENESLPSIKMYKSTIVGGNAVVYNAKNGSNEENRGRSASRDTDSLVDDDEEDDDHDDNHDDDSVYDDDDLGSSSGYDDYDNVEEAGLSEVHTAFAASFLNMQAGHKWVLSSGRSVEDIIYKAAKALDSDSLTGSIIRSFAIDLSDPMIKSWFKESEWDEICGAFPPLPEPDEVLIQSMKRFCGVKTMSDLRSVILNTTFLPEGTEFNKDLHYNSYWADMVFRDQLTMFQFGVESLRSHPSEDWYNSQIWSPIIDKCLLNLPGVTLQRGEVTCRASAFRKNRNRSQSGRSNRQKIGPRLDGIIRSFGDDPYEYGGIEVARSFNGTTSTKWLGDSHKLAKVLRDMLFRLHDRLNHDSAIVHRLQVVGVFNAGLSFQFVRMCNPRGYVSLLRREQRHEIPQSVSELSKLLHLLRTVAQMKEVVRRCAKAVQRPDEEKTADQIFEELRAGEGGGRGKLGWAADSP